MEMKGLHRLRIVPMMIICTVIWSAAVSAAVIIAKVNGKPITDSDVKTALSGFSPGQQASVLNDQNSRRQILDNLIDRELLLQEAKKSKLEETEEFKKAVREFSEQFLSNKVLERNLSSKLSEAAAKRYYEAHKRKFSTDRVHVQHILVNSEAQARDVLKKAGAKGTDFQKLAETISKDPSAKNNRGDLGFITRNSPFVDEFKEAAFTGSEGTLVGPVKTLYGYHVIKVIDKKIGRPLNYDEVELMVKNELRQELIRNYVTNLKRQAKIQVDSKALDRLQ